MSAPSTPHDSLFKATFTHLDLARGELELVLPAEVRAHLDLSTLEVCPGAEELVNAGEQLIAQGLQRGRVEGERTGELRGLRTAIETTLFARGLSLSDRNRTRLSSCTDVATLTLWLTRAAQASAEAEVFVVTANGS